MSLKRTSNPLPSAVIENNILLAKRSIFVKFSSLMKSIIKFSGNKFHDFLPDIDINSFFIKPVDEKEIQNMILSCNPLKAVDPNSIPTKPRNYFGIIFQISCLSCLSFLFAWTVSLNTKI